MTQQGEGAQIHRIHSPTSFLLGLLLQRQPLPLRRHHLGADALSIPLLQCREAEHRHALVQLAAQQVQIGGRRPLQTPGGPQRHRQLAIMIRHARRIRHHQVQHITAQPTLQFLPEPLPLITLPAPRGHSLQPFRRLSPQRHRLSLIREHLSQQQLLAKQPPERHKNLAAESQPSSVKALQRNETQSTSDRASFLAQSLRSHKSLGELSATQTTCSKHGRSRQCIKAKSGSIILRR
jgi:hypothetical protein